MSAFLDTVWELIAVTERQLAALEREDLAAVMYGMDERQSMLDRLTANGNRGNSGAGDIQEALDRLQLLDQQLALNLQEKLTATEGDLRQLRHGKAAAGRYLQTAALVGGFSRHA